MEKEDLSQKQCHVLDGEEGPKGEGYEPIAQSARDLLRAGELLHI
jgi:hypothetical protein